MIKDSKIEKICKHAKKITHRRGEAILCMEGETEVLFFRNYPDRLSSIPYCVATIEFSTGHSTPDTYIEIGKMKECKKLCNYRGKNEKIKLDN